MRTVFPLKCNRILPPLMLLSQKMRFTRLGFVLRLKTATLVCSRAIFENSKPSFVRRFHTDSNLRSKQAFKIVQGWLQTGVQVTSVMCRLETVAKVDEFQSKEIQFVSESSHQSNGTKKKPSSLSFNTRSNHRMSASTLRIAIHFLLKTWNE